MITARLSGKALIAVLFLATLLCLPLRPLWVDEIYQLEATRDQPFPAMLHSAMVAPGGMPLGYAAQKLWLLAAGFSPAQARVPAAIFGLGAVLALAWVAKLLGMDPLPVALVSLMTPLLFRYSTEARPYSQGLFFSILGSALFLRWLQHRSTGNFLAYTASCVVGVYSQPFALFVPLSHGAYLLFTAWRRSIWIVLALGIAGLCYAPWFLLSREALVHEAWPHQMFFTWQQISPLMILREISGGGYACSVPLVILAAIGLRQGRGGLLSCWILVPLILAICADAAFHYFFAIRQLIFIVPPLLLAATLGFQTLWSSRRSVAVGLASIYVAGAVVKDVRWEMDWKEDWGKAASEISRRLAGTHGCVIFKPNRDAPSYYFFQPGLRLKNCAEQGPGETPELTAVSPYAEAADRRAASGGLNVGNTLLVAATPKP